MLNFVTEMTVSSAETIVSMAFGAHHIHQIERCQMESAVRTLGVSENLKKAERHEFIKPIARALLNRGIIKIAVKDTNIRNLCQNDLKKLKAF